MGLRIFENDAQLGVEYWLGPLLERAQTSGFSVELSDKRRLTPPDAANGVEQWATISLI